MHVQARTWVHQDAMRETRVPVATSETFGSRFGDNLFLPMPLRHLAQGPEGPVPAEFFAKLAPPL